MQLPYFYIENLPEAQASSILPEDTSRHVVQVLRMQPGEQINLTNGRGMLATARITDAHKKHCVILMEKIETSPSLQAATTIAIAPIKNSNRFEWFLEKAAELGINHIHPILTERTEKTHLKTERLQQILISAMLQSRQVWLTQWHEPVTLNAFLQTSSDAVQKFIAHCRPEEDKPLLKNALSANGNKIILIGPEGDFTLQEISDAVQAGYRPVSLGNTRLRTETAGVAAAVLMQIG